MVDGRYNSAFKRKNIRQLRRALKMTQKEFIDYFLSNSDNKPSMSIATLSNLESRGGERVNEVVSSVCTKLQIDTMLFSLSTEEFIKEIEKYLAEHKDNEELVRGIEKKVSISKLVNRLTMYFADEMLEGRLKRGDQIESDRELARKLGVGRSAVRESLKVLDVLGMIDIRLGQGTYISSRETNFFSIPLSWSLFLDGDQVDSILTVRTILEIKSAELAAQCENQVKLNRLTDIYNRMEHTFASYDTTDNVQVALKETLDEDIDFHTCIAECSGNPIIISMLRTIRNFLQRVSGTGMVEPKQISAVLVEHKNLYEAIMSHDPDVAAQAMKNHLNESSLRYNL